MPYRAFGGLARPDELLHSDVAGATAPREDEGGSGAARRLANCWRLPPQSEISADNLDELRHRDADRVGRFAIQLRLFGSAKFREC